MCDCPLSKFRDIHFSFCYRDNKIVRSENRIHTISREYQCLHEPEFEFSLPTRFFFLRIILIHSVILSLIYLIWFDFLNNYWNSIKKKKKKTSGVFISLFTVKFHSHYPLIFVILELGCVTSVMDIEAENEIGDARSSSGLDSIIHFRTHALVKDTNPSLLHRLRGK